MTKPKPTVSAEQRFFHIPSEISVLWLSAEAIDLPLLNVSLAFPAAGLMKQCQIRGDIKNRRTSGGGDAFLSVCSVCIPWKRKCLCTYRCVWLCLDSALHAIDANDTDFGWHTLWNPARTAGKHNTALFKHPRQRYTPARKPTRPTDLNWSGLLGDFFMSYPASRTPQSLLWLHCVEWPGFWLWNNAAGL